MRAASIIGQLGDPHYLNKAHALYYEFEEIGLNAKFGYTSAADLIDLFPQFYFDSLSVHLQTASDTSMSQRADATGSLERFRGLYSNVFRAEREPSLSSLKF
jgi:hypothetical protein